MANHSSILAWKIPWTEEPGRLWSRGHKEWDTTEHTDTHTQTHTATPDPMPCTPFSSGAGKLAKAGAQSKPGMVLWRLCTSAARGDSCWHIEVTMCPSIIKNCRGIQASTNVLTREGLVSIAASLPWVPNTCFHVHTFWSTKFLRLISPQINSFLFTPPAPHLLNNF